jgi:hypothetical protein
LRREIPPQNALHPDDIQGKAKGSKETEKCGEKNSPSENLGSGDLSRGQGNTLQMNKEKRAKGQRGI